ncbi:hypothetical protein TrVE_jg2451 [Triparma verrucosa]|uniref:Uncharacterized protein n=1 Tax=Triparma verrucosa TaxID=1606542 RepID=A0A9W7C1L5_9STRA|nr:hypothetical protein TrVE_jg2451 [Triparma verrucosa]
MIEKLYLLLLFCASTTSFLPQHTTSIAERSAASRRTPAFAVPDSAGFTFDPFGGVSEPPPPDKLPPGLSRFLTQRAVQQQLYYYDLNMDETHSNWLCEFLRPENCSALHVDYHGINALPTKDTSSYLCAILIYPEIEVTIKKPMGCAAGLGRGGTGMGDYNRNSNPYLKPRYFEYTELIRPVAVATSLLEIREQIAAELAEDLAFLVEEDCNEVLDSGEAGTTFSTGPNGETVSKGGGRSSPFRLANYDLLKLLATKEALLRLTEPSSSSSSSSVLRSITSTFMPMINGHNKWAHGGGLPSLADNILGELLSDKSGSNTAARRLLEERNRLARLWQEQMLPTLQQEQTDFKRWHLSCSFSVVADDADTQSGEELSPDE